MMSEFYQDPTFLRSVLAMREQMVALRSPYESATRVVENMRAMNDSMEQSLATARDLDLRVRSDPLSIHGADLAEAARAGIGDMAANIEALKARIDSGYGIHLEAVRQSLAANYNIDLDAVKASLAVAYGVDLEAMKVNFAGGLGVDLEAAKASLAAAQSVDLEAMNTSLAGAHGIDLEAVKEMLAVAHGIDFDDLTWPEEPPYGPAADVEISDSRAIDGANAPPEGQDLADGGTPTKAGRMKRAWDVFQVLLTIDTVLGNPGATIFREAVGSVANEVLLFLWLATIAQGPNLPPAPTGPVPEVQTTPTHVTGGSSRDADGLPERQSVTVENGLDTPDRDDESNGKEGDSKGISVQSER